MWVKPSLSVLRVLIKLTTYSQIALLYLQQMALLGFFLPPYAAVGFEPTSAIRVVQDWVL